MVVAAMTVAQFVSAKNLFRVSHFAQKANTHLSILSIAIVLSRLLKICFMQLFMLTCLAMEIFVSPMKFSTVRKKDPLIRSAKT